MGRLACEVVERMRTRHAGLAPALEYAIVDSLALPMATGTVDAVLDKGMYDAFKVKQKEQMLEEVSRVLKPGGLYFCITFTSPKLAFEFKPATALREYGLVMESVELPDAIDYGTRVPMYLFSGTRQESHGAEL